MHTLTTRSPASSAVESPLFSQPHGLADRPVAALARLALQASASSRASTSASAKELRFEFKLPAQRPAIGRVKKLLEMCAFPRRHLCVGCGLWVGRLLLLAMLRLCLVPSRLAPAWGTEYTLQASVEHNVQRNMTRVIQHITLTPLTRPFSIEHDTRHTTCLRVEHASGLALPCRSLWFIDFTGSLKLSPSAKAKAHQKRESMADEDNKKAQQVHRSPLCSSRTRLSRGTERLIGCRVDPSGGGETKTA